MGNQKSKLKEKDIMDIVNSTQFTEEEIRQWHKSFLDEFPTGIMTKQTFATYCSSQFNNEGDSTDYVERAFRTFDANGSGNIDFREFICALSVRMRGTFEQRVNWAFRMYDIDGDGYITKDEMQKMIEAIYKMVGEDEIHKALSDSLTAAERSEKIFANMDINRDNKISLEEFMVAAAQDPSMVLVFALESEEL